MRATLSILGLYDYDRTIFDGLADSLPGGVELDALKANIFQECAQLEIAISDPGILKYLLTSWGVRKRLSWARYNDAINTKYNPLDNYDRTEEESVTEGGTNSANAGSKSNTVDEQTATRSPSLVDETQVSGYNSDGYAPQTKQTHTGVEDVLNDRNASSTVDSASNGKFDRTLGRTVRARGNIGVTSSQQMLTQELELTGLLDIYQYITQDFKRDFCVLVY